MNRHCQVFHWACVGLICFLFIQSCKENDPFLPSTFSEPETRLIADSIKTTFGSTVQLQWSGTVSDGKIGGYFISFDRINWSFTTKQDSLLRLNFFRQDTTYTLYVSSARVDGGNGKWDSQIIRNNLNFGSEPFSDLDSNGIYTNGEPYTDVGNVDSSPASVTFGVSNASPTISSVKPTGFLTSIPDTTYPAIQIQLDLTDPDGVRNLSRIEISFDSTFALQNTVTIPISSNLTIQTTRITILLEALTPKLATTEANVYLVGGTERLQSQRLKNWKLDNNNKLYARTFDLADARSPRISFPDTLTWYTQKVTSNLIIVDDFSEQRRDPIESTQSPDSTIRFIFSQIRNGKYTGVNKYQVLPIKTLNNNVSNRTAAMYNSSPFALKRLLKFYNVVFWYTDNGASLPLASGVLPEVLQSGIDVLMTTGYGASPDAGSLFFSPFESGTIAPTATTRDDTLRPLYGAYPSIRFNSIFGSTSYGAAGMKLRAGSEPLYRFRAGNGITDSTSNYLCARRIYRQGTVEISRLIFTSVGFYSNFVVTTGGSAPPVSVQWRDSLTKFYDVLFRDEFNQ